ncbi:hypothetical protein SAMN05421771_3223 [Granulicella pectinivorans]|jgi:hypothetical protein|uniref:Uncharacterized protein n=1 Tax=Granulicella pectinivorans TaxID=474950 RepID=A0A1I6MPX0_9BACT|nr:hypothetical protein [Granulicella pectinivorans]SFS17657.1 hypothetical protein SAMN05421771_3223 [Granulicella pectinivorans]
MTNFNHNTPLHPCEEDLIAFHLHELADEAPVRAHVEQCSACASLSESIAETLRVFSADAVPQANLDHAWQRLRINLPTLTPVPVQRKWYQLPRLNWSLAGLAAAALLTVAVFTLHPHTRPKNDYAFNHPGPLTNSPKDPSIANHLDSAERLLTEVNHAQGALDPTTRTEAHNLLVKNAVYVSTAHHNGDLAQAAVLEDLGRVLTTIDHEPVNKPDDGWHVRISMNTDGLLLDIRILRQNDQRQ